MGSNTSMSISSTGSFWCFRMNILPNVFLIILLFCGLRDCFAAPVPDQAVRIRVATYNVEFSSNTTPEQIGEMFIPYNLDLIGFNEVPDGDWTARVGNVLGMDHYYVGKISSANHKDKYKSILSRTPLEGTTEHELNAKRRRNWNPASAVRALTTIKGLPIAFYSLHICASGGNDGHAYQLASEVLPKETVRRILIVGDFNNTIGDAAMNTIEAAGMRPTWKDLKIDLSSQFTWNALDPRSNRGVIDHILYGTASHAKATDGAIIELAKPLSDHKPIWSEILFPRNVKNDP